MSDRWGSGGRFQYGAKRARYGLASICSNIFLSCLSNGNPAISEIGELLNLEVLFGRGLISTGILKVLQNLELVPHL